MFNPVFTASHRKHLKILNEPSACLEKEVVRESFLHNKGPKECNFMGVGERVVCVSDFFFLSNETPLWFYLSCINLYFPPLAYQRFSSNSGHVNTVLSSGSKKCKLNNKPQFTLQDVKFYK